MNSPVRIALVVVAAVSVSAGTFAQQRPRALENLQNARERLETGTVEYFYRRAGVGPPAGVYRTARVAGPDLIDVVRGVPNEGEQSAARSRDVPSYPSPVPTLKREHEIWTLLPDSATVLFSNNENAIGNATDIRTLGIHGYYSYSDIHDTLWRDQGAQPGAREYTERVEGDLYIVTAKSDDGEVTWWIDPERDWNAVRVTAAREGKVVAETRISLRRFDGVWFPDAVLNFKGAYSEGAKPVEEIRVVSASFNDPKQPRRFTPADIGVEPGMTVQRPREPDGTPLLFFDGSAAVSEQAYLEKQRRGEIKPGPTLLRVQANAQARAIQRLLDDASVEKQHESLWAEYVRKFILTYQLDVEQANKAITILHECEDRASEYIQKKRPEFEKLEKDATKAAEQSAPDADRPDRIAYRQSELMAPISDIFEKQLKPKLEKLPTRAQRRAAERTSVEPKTP